VLSALTLLLGDRKGIGPTNKKFSYRWQTAQHI